MTTSTRVAMALGGGGARGYAHIGVIQVLVERGYDIVAVSGTSMGALVGGVYAAGQLEAYTEWVGSLTQRDVIRLLDPALGVPGAFRGDRVMARVEELADVLIEDLPIPYTAVATDLLARKEVWFQRGPLVMAIRASIALPTVFPPVMLNGRLLADGSITNPVPIAPLSATPADLTVAVNLAGPAGGRATHAPVHESAEPRPVAEWADRLRRAAPHLMDTELRPRLTAWLAGLRTEQDPQRPAEADGRTGLPEETGTPAAATAPGRPAFSPLPPDLRTLDVMELSLDTVQSIVARYRLASYPPDVMVTVPKSACRTLDFHRGAEMVALGRTLAEQALDASPGGD